MSINDLPLSNFCIPYRKEDPEVAPGNPYKHLVGIELELENVYQKAIMSPSWKIVEDPSLRNGLEFVSKGPTNGLALRKHIHDFYAAGVTYKNSPRASTHIHVNVSDLKVEDVRCMFLISYMLEEALFSAVNADRKFCGYCMPLSEMPPDRIRAFLSATTSGAFTANSFGGGRVDKYYGFNINSIIKHGTVEYRYFPGGPTEAQLCDWVLYCSQVKSAAIRSGIAGLLALDTPELLTAWLREHFPLWADTLLRVSDAAAIHGMYLEAISLLPEQEEFQRKDVLVFVNKELIEFAGRVYLRSDGKINKLRQMLAKVDVLSYNDWQDILYTCREYEDIVPAPASPGKVAIDKYNQYLHRAVERIEVQEDFI